MNDALPCCATCDFYKPPHDLREKVAAASGYRPAGFCQRYPQTIAKQPEEWCGEHRVTAPPDAPKGRK